MESANKQQRIGPTNVAAGLKYQRLRGILKYDFQEKAL